MWRKFTEKLVVKPYHDGNYHDWMGKHLHGLFFGRLS